MLFVCVYERGVLPNSYWTDKSSKRIISLVCQHQNACFTEYKLLSLEIVNIYAVDGMSTEEDKDAHLYMKD